MKLQKKKLKSVEDDLVDFSMEAQIYVGLDGSTFTLDARSRIPREAAIRLVRGFRNEGFKVDAKIITITKTEEEL